MSLQDARDCPKYHSLLVLTYHSAEKHQGAAAQIEIVLETIMLTKQLANCMLICTTKHLIQFCDGKFEISTLSKAY